MSCGHLDSAIPEASALGSQVHEPVNSLFADLACIVFLLLTPEEC